MGWWRNKKKKRGNLKRGAILLENLIECCDGKSNPIKFFSAEEIGEATDSFSKSNLVSELSDSMYKWYSGKTEDHPMILVGSSYRYQVGFFRCDIAISSMILVGSSYRYQVGFFRCDIAISSMILVGSSYRYQVGTFCRDIAISSMVSGHKNFLKLVGCCLESDAPAIVYNGVKKHYTLDISELSWKRRMKIAEDIATALANLHTAFPRPFVYRILSTDNILLDEDGVAKLRDFSFCVSIPKGETFVKVDQVVGTYNYMNLKYAMHGVVSEETDVFAIGMFMLELLIGKGGLYGFFTGEGEGDGDDGSEYTKSMEMIAKVLEEVCEISEEELSQMKAFIMLSQRCISEVEHPTMVEVAKELKNIQRSLKDNSSSPSGETQFDSPQEISSSVRIGLVREVAKELKKMKRSGKKYSYSLSPSPSPSPSDEGFDSPR